MTETKNKRLDLDTYLLTLGISPASKGYQCLRDFFELFGEKWQSAPICDIYKAVAKKEGISPSNVERRLRHMIHISLNSLPVESVMQMFGNTVDSNLSTTVGNYLKVVAMRYFGDAAWLDSWMHMSSCGRL